MNKPNHDSNLAIEAATSDTGRGWRLHNVFKTVIFVHGDGAVEEYGSVIGSAEKVPDATYIAHTKDKDNGYAAYVRYSIGLEKELAERDKKIAELENEVSNLVHRREIEQA